MPTNIQFSCVCLFVTFSIGMDYGLGLYMNRAGVFKVLPASPVIKFLK